ncbi:metalloprotease PmbA [Pseudidiomarina insulisalsae]|uniref:Metalloprotease PmbA n=1 Tax=Pseudidiomarina insulisalsae TaxID=575789 RepID=A0A432YNY5_9GAMM|nr:metalloprotease PmbA [Pseudidiomarina insulisalsae]RUO62653.1 metalloprotease PmbA [Pseudidiomarina insulisalsae]
MKPELADLKTELADVKQAVADALSYGKKLGASAMECALTRSRGISVETRLGEVDTVEFNQDGALGITLYQGQQKGSASTTDLSAAAIRASVEKALDIARFTSPDPCAGLAPAELMAYDNPDLELCHPGEQSADYALEQALQCERHALNLDERIVNSDGASYSSHVGYRVYGNSHGFLDGYLQSRHAMSCSLIGKQGDAMQRDFAYTVARATGDLESPEYVAEQAAYETLARLGARKINTAKVPVIFRADIANSLFGHFVGAISGGNLYRKSSFLLDHLGEQVLPDWLTITETPHLSGALASSPFDHEGVATQNRTMVENGVLQSYLLTSYAARKLQMQPTGHAGGIHTWQLTQQQQSLADLCRTMGTGLLVTEVMGQGVNLVNGDYSRGAAGFWVENGEIQYPVEEITIAGNLKDMLRNIVAIGNDTDLRHGVRTGSVLLESLHVAGN